MRSSATSLVLKIISLFVVKLFHAVNLVFTGKIIFLNMS
jgi:hypothetical protein